MKSLNVFFQNTFNYINLNRYRFFLKKLYFYTKIWCVKRNVCFEYKIKIIVINNRKIFFKNFGFQKFIFKNVTTFRETMSVNCLNNHLAYYNIIFCMQDCVCLCVCVFVYYCSDDFYFNLSFLIHTTIHYY